MHTITSQAPQIGANEKIFHADSKTAPQVQYPDEKTANKKPNPLPQLCIQSYARGMMHPHRHLPNNGPQNQRRQYHRDTFCEKEAWRSIPLGPRTHFSATRLFAACVIHCLPWGGGVDFTEKKKGGASQWQRAGLKQRRSAASKT